MNNLQAINSSRILQYFCTNWITERTTWSNSWRKTRENCVVRR